MGIRQHKFIEQNSNEMVYFEIEYTDETDYQNKVSEIVNANRGITLDSNQEREEEAPSQHYELEDSGEYRQLS